MVHTNAHRALCRPPTHRPAARFEELEYADAASYMEGGRIVFTGSPEQLRQRLRGMGATL